MSSLFTRIGAHFLASALRTFRAKHQVVFSKYLLLTNTAITIALQGAGDVLEQHSRRYWDRHKPLNLTRTAHVCSTGLVFGPMSHYWYFVLDRFLPGRTFRIIGKKILLDQLLYTPVAIGVYLSVLSWLEGARPGGILRELTSKGWKLYKADCIVWPPAQLVNFYLLPTRYRVLYDNTLCLFFDIYYVRVKYDNSDLTSQQHPKKEDKAGLVFENTPEVLQDLEFQDIEEDHLMQCDSFDELQPSMDLELYKHGPAVELVSAFLADTFLTGFEAICDKRAFRMELDSPDGRDDLDALFREHMII